jgi:YgiT-type zinc finger domain-containing protein
MKYGYQCEYCEGTVRSKKVEHEAFKHKKGFVILENITIGVCDVCGNRYYSADIIHTVHEIAAGMRMPERMATIPVAQVA